MAPALWHPLLVQTHDYTEGVFWVSKLNILDGLFLAPSVSILCMPCTSAWAGMCMCVCTLVHVFHCLWYLQAAFDPLNHLHMTHGVYQLSVVCRWGPSPLAGNWQLTRPTVCRTCFNLNNWVFFFEAMFVRCLSLFLGVFHFVLVAKKLTFSHICSQINKPLELLKQHSAP